MTRLTLADRLTSAVLGAVFGAVIGCAIAWILGVYSRTLGAAAVNVSFGHWVGGTAAGFALAGLLFGPVVASLVGTVVHLLFRFERLDDGAVPLWLILFIVLVVVAGVWWASP